MKAIFKLVFKGSKNVPDAEETVIVDEIKDRGLTGTDAVQIESLIRALKTLHGADEVYVLASGRFIPTYTEREVKNEVNLLCRQSMRGAE